MSRWWGGLLLVSGFLLWPGSAGAGDAGGGGHRPGGLDPLLPPPPGVLFNLISQHAADLKLTDEQKKQLEEIRKDLPPPAENSAAPDPAIRELIRKFREAMKSGDKDTAQSLRKQVVEKFKELHPKAAKIIEAIKALLTPDQLEKLRELLKSERQERGQGGQGGKKGGGAGGSPAPSPFDL